MQGSEMNEVNEMNELARRVQEERKRRRWTQQELADRAAVSLGTVSNFERRRSDPQAAHLRALLRALGIEADAGDRRASNTRAEWPQDVKTFLDVMGIYLTAIPEERREQIIYDLTRQIVTGG